MIEILDWAGVFAFALSGAALAVRHRLDIVGAVALALVTGLAGGVIRDLLLGDTPPLALRDQRLLLIPLFAAVLLAAAPGLINRARRPVLVFDAIGLAVFAVVGATKASEAGLGIGATTVVGSIAAVGGGLIRDAFVQRTPIVFTPESGLYVIPASLGAFVVAIGHRYLPTNQPDQLTALTAAAAIVILAVRLGSISFGWKTPHLGSSGTAYPPPTETTKKNQKR